MHQIIPTMEYIYAYENIITSAGDGYNTLNYNSISNNGNGVAIEFSKVNTVMGNNILSNDNGIVLSNSESNIIYDNNLSDIT